MTDTPNFAIFKDCLARRVLALSSADSGADDLDEFTSYLAAEAWPALPPETRMLSYSTHGKAEDVDVDVLDLEVIPVGFVDTLAAYGLLNLPPGPSYNSSSTSSNATSSSAVATDSDSDASDSASAFLRRVLATYVPEACAPPPVWSATRTDACELCAREVPLTYHHLVPRAVQEKALKRGWHKREEVNKVAWLCRHCHSAIHGMMSNEELARDYHSVELLMEREDVQKWARYAAKQRWGARRG